LKAAPKRAAFFITPRDPSNCARYNSKKDNLHELRGVDKDNPATPIILFFMNFWSSRDG